MDESSLAEELSKQKSLGAELSGNLHSALKQLSRSSHEYLVQKSYGSMKIVITNIDTNVNYE